jgi:hypothetical protein
MNTFLGQAAAEIFNSRPLNELQHLRVVLPSRRSALYFGRELASLSSIPFFAPVISSVDDFMTEVSGLRPIGTVELYFELYSLWKEKDGQLSLERFLTWAPTVVRDYNLIDSSLLENPLSLFDYMDYAEALKRWDIAEPEPSELRDEYYSFFRVMGEVYTGLTTTLKERGLGYPGMIYREAAGKIKNWEGESYYYFVGLNALSVAEETLISALVKKERAACLWDTDSFYMNSDDKAGRKLRKYKRAKLFGKEWSFQGNYLLESPKEFNEYALSSKVLQNKLAATFVATSRSSSHAVVVLDETDLGSMYAVVPGLELKVNISGGMGLKTSMIMPAIELLLRLVEVKELRLDYVRAMVEQPLLKALLQHEMGHEAWQKVEKYIYGTTRLYFKRRELNFGESVLWKAWMDIDDTGSFLSALRSFLHLVVQLESDEEPFALLLLEELRDFDKHTGKDISAAAFRLLFDELVKNLALPFEKQPDAKVQVMSMLETRCLDFEEVTFLSFLEGKLPSSKKNNSFLPFDVIQEFGLPTHADQDAIMAYHFFRLLQRAQKVNFMYVQDTGSTVGRAEKSRFLWQIEEELVKKNPLAKLNKPMVALTSERRQPEIVIEKTPAILAKVKSYLENRGLSATALSDYFTSPVQFYWKYIEKIPAKEKDDPTIGHDVFGTIIHYVLEQADTPFVGKGVNKATLLQQKAWVKENFHALVKACKPNFDFDYGLNAVLKALALELLLKYFDQRIKDFKEEFVVHALEERYSGIFEVGGVKVKIQGVVDKIELHGSSWEVIDYKTGKVESKDIKPGSKEDTLEAILRADGKDKFRQLLLYYFLLSEYSGVKANFIFRFYSFRSLSTPLILDVGSYSEAEILEAVRGMLTQMIEELLDEKMPFAPAPERKVYELSDFAALLT